MFNSQCTLYLRMLNSRSVRLSTSLDGRQYSVMDSSTEISDDTLQIGAPGVNVEEVMAQIRANIKQRRIDAQARGLDFDKLAQGRYHQFSGERFSDETYEGLYNAHFAADKTMTSLLVTEQPWPIIGGFVKRIREALHSLVVFYVNRAADRQVGFNSAITKAVSQIVNDLEREAETDDNAKRIALLEARLAQLEQQLAATKAP